MKRRDTAADAFNRVEQVFYVAVAVALAAAGAMLEMGILIGAVVFLGLTVFMLRHTTHTEPRPAHEPNRSN